MSTLVDRLKEAACEAIEAERPDLERQPQRLRGVMLELRLKHQLRGSTVVYEADCYLQRRAVLPKGDPA